MLLYYHRKIRAELTGKKECGPARSDYSCADARLKQFQSGCAWAALLDAMLTQFQSGCAWAALLAATLTQLRQKNLESTKNIIMNAKL